MDFRNYVYYITRVENVPSIMEKGILSHNECDRQKVTHTSFAMNSVQEKRHNKQVPNAMGLHDYANVYFDARNKAMFVLKCQNNHFSELCVLVLDANQLLAIEGAVISDMNAAAVMAKFSPATQLASALDFERIYATSWKHPGDINDERLHGYQKCAELLIPNSINPKHILGAYTQSDAMSRKLSGVIPKVVVKKDVFFL